MVGWLVRTFDTFDRYASDQEYIFGPGLRKVASRRVISCDDYNDVCHQDDEEKVQDNLLCCCWSRWRDEMTGAKNILSGKKQPSLKRGWCHMMSVLDSNDDNDDTDDLIEIIRRSHNQRHVD